MSSGTRWSEMAKIDGYFLSLNGARLRKSGGLRREIGNCEIEVLADQADSDSDFESKKVSNSKQDRGRGKISSADNSVKCLKETFTNHPSKAVNIFRGSFRLGGRTC